MNNYPKLFNFKSLPKQNYFAPEWNYYIAEDMIKNINFKSLSKFLLKKEKEILKITKPVNSKSPDGYTGLGKNSITSRYSLFNVINFKNKEIIKIKKEILNIHDKLLNNLKIKIPKNLWIQCWFNVMRKGQSIKPHIHGVTPNTYLGGHICVQVENTHTNYINPVNQINDSEIYYSKNEVGKITLFQNCIPHFTDMHNSEKERITIAFDLSVQKEKPNINYIKI
jgi:hypothetical protein